MGRKPLKIAVESVIMEVLDQIDFPVSCNILKKEVGKKMGRDIHFDTVKKYVEDLARKNIIFKKQLPPAKKEHKKGVILYSKKPFPVRW
ncbi:MAG: hypothetical protein JW754_01375 [Candidatus Aenigmarchaeota archaeon]|nr:hypothetical protein [Candidatus Aenigmarchaeota archaeon]